MRLPNVLLIGAMKAGTTGLYMDLSEHPDVFLAGDKEPHALCHDRVLSNEGLQEYSAIYAKVTTEKLLIDASTGYSKRPDEEGVAARAIQVLPDDFKVIYLVREPIARIISQHYHEYSFGLVGANIDEAVHAHPRYLNYSRYAYQLESWIECIGLDRIQIIQFEDYVDQRQKVVSQLYDFLGLPQLSGLVEVDKVYNRSQGKPVRNRFWSLVFHNASYRRLIRPLLPVKLRLQLSKLLLPKAPERPSAPQPETVDWIKRQLADDVAQLGEWLNRNTPLWEKFEQSSASSTVDSSVTT